MISRLRAVVKLYPRQFWLVAVIMMLAWTFHSMLWPFLLIYIGEKLNTSLTAVASLLTINAVVGLVTTFLGGAIADRFGRKWVMAVSFILCAFSWYLFQLANSVAFFVALMALNGATTPLYRLAADAMMADLVPPENRIEAYSILRMGNNLGVALGPMIGGFTAAISYNISFTIAGVGILLCGLLVMAFSAETIPVRKDIAMQTPARFGGYGKIFRDRQFLSLIGAFILNRISSATIWLMLGVYVKSNFGMSEKLFGFIPMTNAAMVIFFQVLTTRWVKRHDPRWMMVLGAAFYGVAVFAVAFGQGFWAFWLCMVVATIGEMILVPITTTTAAGMAPEDMRGRYMSVYTLTSGVGSGVGPLLGGFMSDSFGPVTTWYGGGLIGFAGAAAFLVNLLVHKRKLLKEELLTQE
jgi:MFS family permease